MLIQKETSTNNINIRGYRPGAIRINDKDYQSPILVSAAKLEEYTEVASFHQLTAAKLRDMVNDDTELLLLGCGEKHAFLPPKETAELLQRGIAVESMTTRNACHTFQVLVYENRKIIALLFP